MAIEAAAVRSTHRWHCLQSAARFSSLAARSYPCKVISKHFCASSAAAATTAAISTGSTAAMAAAHTVPGDMVQDNIALTSEEKDLFATLLAAAKFAGTNTVLRAAGGWVRDKLLGKESKDIDIALDNMLGKDFADKVNEYLASQGKATHTTAVIHSNPDQSKHLETARMKVNNLWIDLVNLRSETYADGSRIPTMQFGTPLQDAMRRDFTINSLFYNLNEGVVEDFTGKGLEDLRQGNLRTPLPPQETFRDDPLRVLRAVRFATRFGFAPDSAILAAASSEEVRVALGSKVSRERIGTELEGMFDGRDPAAAVRLLHRLSLFPQVFTPPPQLQQLLDSDFGGPCVEVMEAAQAVLHAVKLELSRDEQRLLLLAALLLPMRQLSYTVKGNKQQPASSHIIRESLKWRVKEVDGVAALHTQVLDLAQVYQEISGPGALESAPEQTRIMYGRVIRQLKAHWKLGVLLVPLLQLPAATPLGVEPAADAGRASLSAKGGQQLQQQVDTVQALLAAAAGFELEDAWQWKPLLDGKQLIDLLAVPKGPMLGQLTAAVVDWQLAHPRGDRQGCIQHIQELYKSGKLQAASQAGGQK